MADQYHLVNFISCNNFKFSFTAENIKGIDTGITVTTLFRNLVSLFLQYESLVTLGQAIDSAAVSSKYLLPARLLQAQSCGKTGLLQ
jgi:hypothetical protein